MDEHTEHAEAHPEGTSPADFRKAVRQVIKDMDRAERLAFLRSFPDLARHSRQDGRKWLMPLDLLVDATREVRTIQHVSRFLQGVLTLLPLWGGTNQAKARESLEVMVEDLEAAAVTRG